MEKNEELKQAEGHLKDAEAELERARIEEQAAIHNIDKAVEEIREAEHHNDEIHFTVDGEEEKTTHKELTPNYIIKEFGQKDPATHYLVEIKGTHKISFRDKGDEKIRMHDGMAFQIVSIGPTPVSDAMGSLGFMDGLRTLGYEPQTLRDKPANVFFDYPVEVGRFSGRAVRLGFVVPPDFPNISPTGPHVSPHIQAIHTGGDLLHPLGGVHPSSEFAGAGGEWQYWSRPCPDWGQRKRTVAAYMAHIWRLWETQ